MHRLFPFLFLVGCGTPAVVDEDGGTDATTPKDASTSDSPSKDGASDAAQEAGMDGGADADMDAGDPDTGVMDAGPPQDGGCLSANDCKLFSSYCQQWPCVCMPLEKNQPNPQCMGMVSCFVDPCLNKVPACKNGMCAVGP